MRAPYPAHQSEGPHFTILAHVAFEYDSAVLVEDDHLERRTTLAGFAWPDETHHFVSQSASYVLAVHGLYCLQPFVLDPRVESTAGLFSFFNLSSKSRVRLGRGSTLHPSNLLRQTRGAQPVPRSSYMVESNIAI